MSTVLAALVNGAILGAIVTCVVGVLLRLTPRRALNAATRYAIWWAALLVVVLLPVFYLPIHFRTAGPPAVFDPTPAIDTASIEAIPESIAAAGPAAVADTPPASRWPAFPIEIRGGRWLVWIAMAWAAAALLLLARLAASCVLLERRKARSFPAPAHLTDRLETWLALCGTRRRVRLAASGGIATPMAAGLWCPSILIPARLLAELRQDELDQIGLHEAAHLARRDDFALVFERVLEALFVFHPVVRWITRRLDLEREIACDDFVIAATGRSRPYAACLTRVVELAGGLRGSLVAAAAAEERSHLARRVEMLLDKTRHTGTRLLKARLTAVVVVLAALLWAASKTPALIAFAMPLAESFEQASVAQPPEPPQPPQAPAIAPALPAPAMAPARPAPLGRTAETPPAPAAPFAPGLPAIAPGPPPLPLAPPEPLAWAPQTPPSPPSSSINESRHSGSRNVDWHWSDGLRSRDLRMSGEIEFTDDESDIKSISPGGWFSFEESRGFSSRRYQAMADGSGQISRRYLVDGREKPFDDEGRAWLRSVIPELLRETGIDAPARVRRILRQGGAQAVLAEIAKIQSNGSRRRYIQELVPIGNLSTTQFQDLLRLVRNIQSDGDKSGTLIFLAPYTLKDNLRDYVFDAVSTIHSSGDRRRVLIKFAEQDPSRATLAAAARSAEGIASDGDKAGVLIELAAHYRGNEDMRRPFFRAVESINSAGDRSRVLMAVIAAGADQKETLADALRTSAAIHSDGDKARVLVHAVAYWKEDDAVRRAYFDAANSVNSSGDHARVLTTLVGRGDLGEATLIEAVRSAERINSDGDKARVLLAIVGQSSGKRAVRAQIRNAVRSLHSDGEYRRVMSALDKELSI
jgi:beta-lactamase regulating signal transducer with metallopeptidase domain